MVPSYKDGVEFVFALGLLEKYDDRPHFESRLEDVFKEEWGAAYAETQDFLAAVWKVYDKRQWRHAECIYLGETQEFVKRVQKLLSSEEPSSVFLRKSSFMANASVTLAKLVHDAEKIDRDTTEEFYRRADRLMRLYVI